MEGVEPVDEPTCSLLTMEMKNTCLPAFRLYSTVCCMDRRWVAQWLRSRYIYRSSILETGPPRLLFLSGTTLAEALVDSNARRNP